MRWEKKMMKTIGMIGGMSWESSAVYYQMVNQRVRDRLGGLHSARCILYPQHQSRLHQHPAIAQRGKRSRHL